MNKENFSGKKGVLIQIFIGCAFLILFSWVLNHMKGIGRGFLNIMNILEPFIVGSAIAFVINVPMRGIEHALLKHTKGKKKRLVRAVSMVLSYALAFFIIWFVIMTVVPEVVDTISQLNKQIPKAITQLQTWLKTLSVSYPQFEGIADSISDLGGSWDALSNTILGYLNMGTEDLGDLLTSTLGIASTVIGTIVSLVIALIFSMYILAQKKKLGTQGKMILYAYLPKKHADKVLELLSLADKTFSGFIAGQCTEALAFGCFIFIGMTIFRFPYSIVISVLLGFTTLIPYFGAFIGTLIGAFLILVSSPLKALGFIVMVLVFQQIDNNLIYPRIVGTSVGLPGIWVIVAVTVGGSIWSVGGMLVAVPLASVFYTLLGSSVRKCLARKKIGDECTRMNSD